MPGPTPRQRARADTLQRIKQHALTQLAHSGAGEVSLRAIARELGLVSSAIYRYYPSRDELLTALIVDAYDDLGAVLESAGRSARRSPRRRWCEVAHALRDWALREPHRFALIYGSPIPGYRAPAETTAPATRVWRAFAAPLAGLPGTGATVGGRRLRDQLDVLAATLGLPSAGPLALAFAAAVSQLIGQLTLEFGGHFVNTFEPADDVYAALVEQLADRLTR